MWSIYWNQQTNTNSILSAQCDLSCNRASLARKGSLVTEVSAASVYYIIHLRPNPAVAPSHCKPRIGPFSSGNRESIFGLIADLVFEIKIEWFDESTQTPWKNTKLHVVGRRTTNTQPPIRK